MRLGRCPVSPAMVVAVTALAVALGGSAIAAGGGFAGSEGTIQGCVTGPNFVRSLTGTVGSVIVVAPGQSCPSGTTLQTFSAAPPTVLATHSAAPIPLGTADKIDAGLSLPGGNYVVNTTTQIDDPASNAANQTFTCRLVDPSGRTIPNTASSATIPAGTPGDHLTIPITVYLTNMPAGSISVACKDPVAAASAKRARIAKPSPAEMASYMMATEEAP